MSELSPACRGWHCIKWHNVEETANTLRAENRCANADDVCDVVPIIFWRMSEGGCFPVVLGDLFNDGTQDPMHTIVTPAGEVLQFGCLTKMTWMQMIEESIQIANRIAGRFEGAPTGVVVN